MTFQMTSDCDVRYDFANSRNQPRHVLTAIRPYFSYSTTPNTRMVQLPATAAIEYVAACCRTRTRTRTKIGTITKTVRGPYARSPQVQYVQGGPKKVSLRSLHITSSHTGRFSKFFHCHILQEICNKLIVKYSTSPQMCRYTTLWNIYVRKLVNQWNLSHHFVSQNWNITNICNILDQCCW